MSRLVLTVLIAAGLFYLNELGTHRIEVDRDFPVELRKPVGGYTLGTYNTCTLDASGSIPDSCVDSEAGRIIFQGDDGTEEGRR